MDSRVCKALDFFPGDLPFSRLPSREISLLQDSPSLILANLETSHPRSKTVLLRASLRTTCYFYSGFLFC